MTLQFRATLIESNPKAERPATTYWSDEKHAEQWARSIVAASPDPKAFVSITRLTEMNVAIIRKEPAK